MKFKIGKSQIEGKGLIVKEPIREGELIGLAHIDDQPTDVVGKYHNHEDEPSAASVQMGNKRYLFALRELNPGDEITTDYRKQPELEQPKDFKKGGEYTPQKDGYRTYSPFRDLPYIDIESDTIDTDNIVYDLKLVADNGVTKIVAKNSGMHTIPGATVIREIPIKKRGGLVKMPKPSKKGLASKAYTRSLDGTNKMFTENYLFEKPKSRKRKVFDPNATYYQQGGELPEDYQQFVDYSATAPENRQPGPGYYYGTPNEYDHYGMWEALGKPNSFEQALEMNPDWQQDEEGYYHGYSVNPYTGVFLKSGAPGLEEGDTKWMEIAGHYLSPRANESTPVYDTDLQRFKYIPSKEKGGFHDDLGKYRKVLKHIIYGAGVGLTKAEYGMPMGGGMSQNYMGRTKSFYQEGGENRALTPTGEEDLYSAGELDQVTVKDKMPDWARFQKEYQNIKPLDSYIAEEKRKYLRRGNKALNKMAGVTETNFPKDVEERFRQEYNQKMNTYATRKLGKKQGFNPRRRGEWVDELSQREFDVVAQSKYGSKLSPDVWSRFLSGAQGAANTLLPGQPVNFKIPGLTKREMQDARQNSLEAFELLAPLDVPGIAIANQLTNANIENPNIMSGETMANVSPLATIGLNPLLAVDMFGLTKLPKGIYTGTKALGKGAVSAGRKIGQAGKYLTPEETVDLWRIQERGARPMAELAAEGKLGPMFQNEKAIQHFKDREKYFGQWFTKDKNDFDFYKTDREFTDPEIIQLRVPKNKLQEFQNYDKSLSRASDREFVIPSEQQELYRTSNAPVRSGLGGMDMSRYEIKNPDYFTQLLNTYDGKNMSPKNRKFYESLIASVKKQDGLVSERQYNELQRLKTGDFNFGKKAYQEGGNIISEHGWDYTKVGDKYLTRKTNSNDWIEAKGNALNAIKKNVYQENQPVAQPIQTPINKNVTANPSEKNRITQLQKQLKEAGYDLGNYGPNKDGVDGVLGNKTKLAFDAYNASIPPNRINSPKAKAKPKSNNYNVNQNLKEGYLPYLDVKEETCVEGKGCSHNVSVKMNNLLGKITNEKVWANDAWFNKSDMINKGGDLVYETDEKNFSKMPKVPKDVYSKLQVGDYVQLNRINTATSDKFSKEKKDDLENEGIEHLGFIVGKDKDGTPLVWHGSSTGNAYIDRIDGPITLKDHDKTMLTNKDKNVFTYKVSSIVRDPKLKGVDFSGLQNSAYYKNVDPNQKLVTTVNSTDLQKKAANVINKNISNIKNLGYSQEDANFIGQILVGGIMQNETKGGEDLKAPIKETAARLIKNVADIKAFDIPGSEYIPFVDGPVRFPGKEFKGDEASIGYYQMKPTLNFVNKDGTLNSLGKKLQRLGVNPKDIGTFDIDAQTKAGTIILLDNYEKLKKDPKFNIKTGLYNNKIPASYILAKSWQAGSGWESREKYDKFLKNLDINYSNSALKNASATIKIEGSDKNIDNEYAIVKAEQDRINAQRNAQIAAAEKKAYEAKVLKERQEKTAYEKGKEESRRFNYPESTSIKNAPKTTTPAKPKITTPVKPAPKTSIEKLQKNLSNNPLDKNYYKFSKGGFIETELTPEEIEAYRAEGWIVEDL